jgi:hypothetical protein
MLAAMLMLLAQDATPHKAIVPGPGDAGDPVAAVTTHHCTQDPDQITVCARPSSADRLPTLREQAAIFEPKPVTTRFKLAGADGDVHAEQRAMGAGVSAPAAMVKLRWHF